MIHVVAVITARPGKREAILRDLHFVADLKKNPPGKGGREPQGSWGDA